MEAIAVEEKKETKQNKGEESLLHKIQVSFFLMSILPLMVATYMVVTYVFPNTKNLREVSVLTMLMLLVAILGFVVLYQLTKGIARMAIHAKSVVEGKAAPPLRTDSGGQEVNELARSFNRITSQLEDKVKHLEDARNETRRVLEKITAALATGGDIKRIMEIIISTTAQALQAEKGLLLLVEDEVDQPTDQLKVSVSFGWDDDELGDIRIKRGEGLLGRVAQNGQSFLYSSSESQRPPGALAAIESDSDTIVAVPLISSDKILGVLSIHNKQSEEKFVQDDLVILNSLATQLVLVFQNHQLQANIDQAYLDTIAALAMAVESRDKHTRGHTERVKEYAVKLGKSLGVSHEELEKISNGALLHDLGKIGVADAYLYNEGDLTPEEWKSMRQHPVIGESIVKPVVSMRYLCPIIRHHHEKYNGEGYPDGLKGEEIPLAARILSVADAFDAMTTDRPYRKALSLEDAQKEIETQKGSHFDPAVVDHLSAII